MLGASLACPGKTPGAKSGCDPILQRGHTGFVGVPVTKAEWWPTVEVGKRAQ